MVRQFQFAQAIDEDKQASRGACLHTPSDHRSGFAPKETPCMPFIEVLPRSFSTPVSNQGGVPMLSIRRVAEQLSVSVSTVRREVRRGRLRTIRVAGILRISQPDLDAYIAKCAKR